ncbi:MAG: hypothetical protein ACFFAE_19370 [Candidatus Hodarchaeota archaeon]
MEKNNLLHIFCVYDIWGKFNQDLTPETVIKIEITVVSNLEAFYPVQDLKMVFEGVIRHSSSPLTQALISGLLSSSVDVTYAGIVPFGVF